MRRSLWIAWLLMVCLLPLRGWAQAGMQAGAGPAAVSGMPCHDGTARAQASSPASPESASADPAPACAACAACDLCHVAALPASPPHWPPGGAPRTRPEAAPVPDTGRADPDRLERPPRLRTVH